MLQVGLFDVCFSIDSFQSVIAMWSISPTFYEHICANILAPKKAQTSNVSTIKVPAKLLYEKDAR
jgi:hypothetical protein